MTSAPVFRRFVALASLSLAALLSACAAPEPAAPPPPPASVAKAEMPRVRLSSKVIEQASAYRAYVGHAESISPAFTDGDSIARSLKTGEAYEPHQLLQGAIAYGAVVALQDPGFVATVRTYANDPEQRRTIAYAIMRDPNYVTGFAGASGAAGLVMTALGDDGRKLLDVGKSVKQAAYDVQHSPWSKAEVADRETRLAMAKQLSSTPALGEIAETSKLETAVSGGPFLGLTGTAASPPFSPIVTRSMAVAALAALGYADDSSLDQVMPMLSDPAAATCFSMSKLNLFQCLAVSRPHYEDVFCLGQHILMDTGACLMKGAGVPGPLDIKPQTVAEASSAPASSKTSTSRRKKR